MNYLKLLEPRSIHNLQPREAFVPADDLTVGGDQGRAEDESRRDDEAVGRVAVEIFQTAAFDADLGMERFETDWRLKIFANPTVNVGLKIDAALGRQHGYFPDRNGWDNRGAAEVLQYPELRVSRGSTQPYVRVENERGGFLKHRRTKFRPC